ncbi:MAG: transporter ATP-binding protein [Candidatus Saccharibacteria bacterium]|nr:transporter ATP-binding protein [Candidatus Saccharibacteria bacterium]
MSALIETNNLIKTYGKGEAAFTALKGLSLEIKEGETVAIVGKSGSGKSTLMHLLALLDTPTTGSVSIDGKNATSLKRRQVDQLRNNVFGFVFQQFFLNANDTVLNNVILPLKIAGVGVRERNKRGLEVLRAVDMEDKAKNKASDLSGGQKQRVCIARALINEPKIIFADEPTGNLDSNTGGKIEDLLFNLNREKGITIIFVTHDDELAARCQRRIYIKDGEIEKENK